MPGWIDDPIEVELDGTGGGFIGVGDPPVYVPIVPITPDPIIIPVDPIYPPFDPSQWPDDPPHFIYVPGIDDNGQPVIYIVIEIIDANGIPHYFSGGTSGGGQGSGTGSSGVVPGQKPKTVNPSNTEGDYPPISNCDKRCEVLIQNAWAGVMADIQANMKFLLDSLGGSDVLKQCNKNFYDMISCLSALPDTVFGAHSAINIQCDSRQNMSGDMGQMYSNGILKLDCNAITDPANKFDPNTLKSVILHELTHGCNLMGGHSSFELDSKFIDTWMYGTGYPIGINSTDKNGNHSWGEFNVICNDSNAIKKKIKSNEPSNIIRSENIGWDTTTGLAWIYCDDSRKIPLDGQNILKSQINGLPGC